MVCNLRHGARSCQDSLCGVFTKRDHPQRQPDQSQDVRLCSKRVVQRTLPISCRLREDDALAKGLQDAFDEDGRTCRDANLGGQQRFHDVEEDGGCWFLGWPIDAPFPVRTGQYNGYHQSDTKSRWVLGQPGLFLQAVVSDDIEELHLALVLTQKGSKGH